MAYIDIPNIDWTKYETYLIPLSPIHPNNMLPCFIFHSAQNYNPGSDELNYPYDSYLKCPTIPADMGYTCAAGNLPGFKIRSYFGSDTYSRIRFYHDAQNDRYACSVNTVLYPGADLIGFALSGYPSFGQITTAAMVVIEFANKTYVGCVGQSSQNIGDDKVIATPQEGLKSINNYSYSGFQIRINNEQLTRINSNAIANILESKIKYIPPDKEDPDPNTNPSSGGGGGGTGKAGGDTNEDDGVPSLSATDCGLLTAFSVDKATLKSLGNYLWSDSFNLDTFKKMFNDPFDAILGLQMIPITPTNVSAGNIIFGNTDTGISANVINDQWIPVDMGTLDLKEIYNSALDYEPTTQVSIYLPYIGVRQLNTVDVMASSLHLLYKFDVLTGSIVAQLYVNHQYRNNTSGDFSRWTKNQGFLYSFEGQCSCNIPLSSQDYSNIVRSAISGVGMAAGAAASVATGNPAIGAATLAVGMANSGIQAQGSVIERSGHLSGTQGFLDYQTPMLFVIRPHRDKPSKYYSYRGVPAQTTAKLSACSGYTQIADGVTISAAGATQSELDELTTLCRQGVIL